MDLNEYVGIEPKLKEIFSILENENINEFNDIKGIEFSSNSDSLKILSDKIDSVITELGTVNDDEEDNTLLGKIYILERHIHAIQKTYPYLADGITLTGGVQAWTLGNKIEVIPANFVNKLFDIHCINTGQASATDTYQIVLWTGLAGQEVISSSTRVVKDSQQSGILTKAIITPLFSPNTRISASLASKSGGSDTLVISVEYHEY
jgi:hypothetical protein